MDCYVSISSTVEIFLPLIVALVSRALLGFSIDGLLC